MFQKYIKSEEHLLKLHKICTNFKFYIIYILFTLRQELKTSKYLKILFKILES